MTDPNLPDMPPDADPTAILAFMQRLMTTLQQGGDVDALLAQAPPGFDALFLEAQRRMAAGELEGLDLDPAGMGLDFGANAMGEADEADGTDEEDGDRR